MKNFILFATAFLSLFLTRVYAQETFECQAKAIGNAIEIITKEEKDGLKTEIETVNADLEKGTISKEQAAERKTKLAEQRAKNIEQRVAVEQAKLVALINAKVDGKISETPKNDTISQKKEFSFKYKNKKDNISERRTTSQFVFAAGLNNLVADKHIANSDFRYWGSHFYEWGFTNNTRLLAKNNLLHLKYGLSLMYNNLRPTDNREFVVNGNQTTLETSSVNLKDSRFRNVYLVLPIHFEFDFSETKIKDGKQIFNSHNSLRIGLGGYAGLNVKSKQILVTEENGYETTSKTKGSFNVNQFIYGASAYIGYKETSLYVKYDISPLFKDNLIQQNNVSLGIRFDFN